MEQNFLKDKRFFTGLIAGIIFSLLAFGVNKQYLEKKVSMDEPEINVEEEQDGEKDLVGKEDSKTTDLSEIGKAMTPETPHSPELQRLDLILREAGRMVDRIDKGVVDLQTANVNQ